MSKSKFYKGDRVKLSSLLPSFDVLGRYFGYRPTTREEIEAWYASDESKGMNCAGETKLPPQTVRIELVPNRAYTVVRARCRPVLGWTRSPGQALVRCPETGVEFYVKRDFLVKTS